jgi:hypothetical protein
MNPLARPLWLSFCSLMLAAPAVLAGCADDDDMSPITLAPPRPTPGGGGSGGSGGGSGGGGSGAELPSLADLPANKFTFLKPGGKTTCARGGEYGFYVRPGATDKVVINFNGGGACWDDATCALGDLAFSDKIQPEPGPVGITNFERAENPLRDWTHVVVPYCTGDVHWGDNVSTYAGNLTLNHVGAVNARAVLGWVYSQFEAPARAFVTGCSAGSYGSIFWAADVREHYKDAPTAVAQFGDAGAGIITDSFFQAIAERWKPAAAYPTWGADFGQYTDLSSIYIAIADHYPTTLFSQLTTQFDQTQVQFYTFMGATDGKAGWSQKMLASYKKIDDETDNFASYVASGDVHCAIEKEAFYTVNENGVKLSDWVGKLTGGELSPSVACPDCAPAAALR